MNLLLSLLLAAIPTLAHSAPKPTVDVDRIEDSTVYFKAGEGESTPKPLKTGLDDLKYLGPLRPPESEAAETPTYFLFAAKGCKGCTEDSAIYALKASGGKPFTFVHPGKLVDPKSSGLLLESRAFFGRCLWGQKEDVYVVFQKERVDRRHQLQPSVLVASPGPDHLNERLIERRLPRLQDTLRLVKAKSCKEIEGRNRIMTKQKLNLRRSEASLEKEAEEDEREKDRDNDEAREVSP